MDFAHPPKLLYAARKCPNATLWTPEFIKRLEQIGELTILENAGDTNDADMAARIREADVVLTDWSARTLPLELADDPGKLRYICHLQGSVRHWVPRRFIEEGIQVTNWGDLPADGVAEGALTLLLAVLKRVIPQTDLIRAGGWGLKADSWMGTLHGLRVGVYGLGVIGRRFTELVGPFNPRLSGFDPFLKDWPAAVDRRDSLDLLCKDIDCLVVTTGLTDETRGSLTGPHFAMLPDGGIVINVARGGIIDQPALFAEVERGRLRAGLDVLDTDGEDWLPPDHPARSWPNLLLSAHGIGRAPWNKMMRGVNELGEHQEIALRNLERFVAGEPLLHAFDLARYDLST
jgi:phosphoglycerate dehydrogenase-like enzyme